VTHFDHLDVEAINAIRDANTVIFANPGTQKTSGRTSP
jgi:L-ascorbate metabolism protein UlaG (beta-lactamase superfamily)